MNRLGLVSYKPTPIIRQDAEILASEFDVEELYNYNPIPIAKVVRRCDVVLAWFADVWAAQAVFWAERLGKKSIVIAGGYDIAGEPRVDYGLFRNHYSLRRIMALYALYRADVVVAVSQYAKSQVLARARPRDLRVIQNAVDTDFFRPRGQKSEIVLTVVGKTGGRRDMWRLKGLDAFVTTAAALPMYEFHAVGIHAPPGYSGDVTFHGWRDREELRDLYQRAQVYCQLSYYETYGMAAAEAMACGCTPVVTNRGALPEVVGSAGHYVPYGNSLQTKLMIERAMNYPSGEAARDRIVGNFAVAQRRDKLINLIEELL